MGEKVLIVGGGGREHALGYSIAKDPEVDEVIYAKGNPGTEAEEKSRNVDLDGTKKENFPALAELVEKEDIGMIVVGPEQPLVDGAVDFFNEKGFKDIFGPPKAASKVEEDKFFSFDKMKELQIPQADSIKCYSTAEAEEAIRKMATDKGVVIKARGLTGGKGVYVCDSADKALAQLPEHIKSFKSEEVLIAERLFGQEFSVFALCDGKNAVPLEVSIQDHKPLLDMDKGPNTGGMGAYCPAPIADKEVVKHVASKFMEPVVQKLNYTGFLYAGVIMTDAGPKMIEFNCRFGDPEAEPGLEIIDGSIFKPIKYALNGRLNDIDIEFKEGACVSTVMASNGYPKAYEKGYPIGGLDEVAEMENIKVFHAGTGTKDGQIITNGGRVLCVNAYSEKGIIDARIKSYLAVKTIDRRTRELNNKVVFIYRSDISDKALKKV